MAFAIRVGAAPIGATKQSHHVMRDRYKQVVLATQYGMGAGLLAVQCDCSEVDARRLLDEHRRTFSQYWCWIDGAVNYLNLHGRIWTVFGWPLHLHNTSPRTAQNFPMQANGAEMLRLACIYLTEAGIRVCAPIHDAVLIEAPVDAIEVTVRHAQRLMAQASRDVLGQLELRTNVDVVKYPNRYQDPRGQLMWRTITKLLADD
jgi:DNA polymerase I-like protein with 3'-5' exonuclease and polymerase domains